MLVADKLHMPQGRPLDHLENHDHPLTNPDVLRVDIDELPAAMEGTDILFDGLRVKALASPGVELGQLRDLDGFITLNPHLNDPVFGCCRR